MKISIVTVTGMKKIFTVIKQNLLYFLPAVLLGIFILSIWDKNYYIGGDFIFPLKPENSILRSIYLWEEQNGGYTAFKYMLFFWQGFFYLFSSIGFPSFIIIKIFIVCLYSLGFTFAFLTFKNLFKGTEYGERKLALLAALMFFLNPAAILVLIGAIPLYAFPICFYFIIKYLDSRNSLHIVFFALFFNVSFFTEGPQIKLPIIFVVGVIFLLLLYKELRQVTIRQILSRMLVLTLVTIFLNAFILLPFVNDTFGEKGFYKQYSQEVSVYEGNADLYSAALPFTTRFYNSNLVNKETKIGQFLQDPLFIFWTFLLWAIALSGVFLIREDKEKRVVYVLLAALVFFIFIAKGANPPFGEIYRFLLFNIPPFKIFRTTSTVVIGGTLFFSFLLAISIFYLTKKWRGIFYLVLIINILIFHPVYLGYKLYYWKGGGLPQRGFSIPQEYFQMGELLDNLEEEAKVLALPLDDGYVVKNWHYMGQSPISWLTRKPFIHGNIKMLDNIEALSSTQSCFLTSLYNVGYVLQEKDTLGKMVMRDLNFPAEKVMENKYFLLEKINNSCVLPHFYIPNEIVYFQGDSSQIANISNFPDLNLPPLIYSALKVDKKEEDFTPEEIFRIQQDKELIKRANWVFVETGPLNPYLDMKGKTMVRLDLDQRQEIEVFYPYTRIRPSSLFYPLVLFKENISEKKDQLNPRALFDKQILFASKRIREIENWGTNNSWWQNNLKRYEEKIEKAIVTALKLTDKKEGLQIVIGHLNNHQQRFENVVKGEGWSHHQVDIWTKIFDNLRKRAIESYSLPQFSELEYSFDIPQAGNYNLNLISKDTFSKTKILELKVSLNGKQITGYDSRLLKDKNIIDIGKSDLEIGTNNLKMVSNPENLIDLSAWQKYIREVKSTEENGFISFTENEERGYSSPSFFQEINGWENGATYLLKIKYQSEPKATLKVLVAEEKFIYEAEKEKWERRKTFAVEENIREGNEFAVLLRADDNSLGAEIHLSAFDGDVRVYEIELKKMIAPRLFLKTERNLIEELSLTKKIPQLTFRKINPTKYQIKVDNAKNPYMLVFSESFDPGWRAYVDKTQNEKPIPKERHLMANGYANAWLILPSDASGKENYEVIVEYYPQRLLYIGSGISLLTILGLFGHSVLHGLYKKKSQTT